MERLAELISKLKEQFEQNADKQQLLVITRMIEQELLQQQHRSSSSTSSSKISVVMPSPRVSTTTTTTTTTQVPPKQPAPPPPKPVAPVVEQEKPKEKWNIDPLVDVPTLAQQRSSRELNETIAISSVSRNDQLKNEVLEVGHRLTDSPIRDLKKGIGVNDRYVFINELFRGDEVMYERSIKTINNFRIYAEAQYWIERELKVKLGWDDSKHSVRTFYQLVRRRFL